MQLISGKQFDEERALYGSDGVRVENCRFEGPADGESALKESRNIRVQNCHFALRYPFWHDTGLSVSDCTLADTCRAAFWYDNGVSVQRTSLGGIKAFRECTDVRIEDCTGVSEEFGWNCRKIDFTRVEMQSMYFLFGASDVTMTDCRFSGRYSFQYVKNAVIKNSELRTKDAFWHSENVTVYDSLVAGEYLGWYSKNLRLVRCRITGTQPLCYCENLILEDCETEGCDLAFENCTVQADIRGHIDSVKNPTHGRITADSIGEIICDRHARAGSDCMIEVRK